jgi:hypothetical protein
MIRAHITGSLQAMHFAFKTFYKTLSIVTVCPASEILQLFCVNSDMGKTKGKRCLFNNVHMGISQAKVLKGGEHLKAQQKKALDSLLDHR